LADVTKISKKYVGPVRHCAVVRLELLHTTNPNPPTPFTVWT